MLRLGGELELWQNRSQCVEDGQNLANRWILLTYQDAYGASATMTNSIRRKSSSSSKKTRTGTGDSMRVHQRFTIMCSCGQIA